MLDEYKIEGQKARLEIEVQKEVGETLKKMEAHMKISVSELANTALKRFITAHKDFLPSPRKG